MAVIALYVICACILLLPFAVIVILLSLFASVVLKLGGEWLNGLHREFNCHYGRLVLALGGSERGSRIKFIGGNEEDSCVERTRTVVSYKVDQFGRKICKTENYIYNDDNEEWIKISSVEGLENDEECEPPYLN